jgi:hypothetical protein
VVNTAILLLVLFVASRFVSFNVTLRGSKKEE